MKQSSLSGGGLVFLAIALAGMQPMPAGAQSPAPATPNSAAATPIAPEPAAPPETPPVAATVPSPAAPEGTKSETETTDPQKAATAKTETPKAEPEKPTLTAALPEAPKPATTSPTRGSAQTEQHIARLRAALKITPAQQPQWDAFAQVMRENAAHMDSVAKSHPTTAVKMNAVEGLKSYEQVTQAHLEDLQKLEPAFEALYGTLSDSQKKSADAMFSRTAEAPKPKPAKAGTPTPSEQ